MTAKLLRGCCKAVMRLLQGCHVCRATCPTKATNQHIRGKGSSGEKPAATRQETAIWPKGNLFWQEKLPKSPFLPLQKEERRFRAPRHMVFNSETTVFEQQFFGTFILQLPPPDDTAHAEGRASWPALAILFRLGCRQSMAADAYLRFFRESLGTFILAPSPSESTPLTT